MHVPEYWLSLFLANGALSTKQTDTITAGS